jgi:hypothetical protein
VAALPLARSLQRSAPGLSQAAVRLGPFLRSTRHAAEELHPAIGRASDLLSENAGAFAALRTGLGQATADSPVFSRFMDAVEPAAPAISAGFFKNFPDQATEPGNQPFDPFADARRHYWRGAAVITCQTFGLRIHPGCLADFLKSGASGANFNLSRGKAGGAPPNASQLQLPSLGDVQKALPDLSQQSTPSTAAPASPRETAGLLDFLLGK